MGVALDVIEREAGIALGERRPLRNE